MTKDGTTARSITAALLSGLLLGTTAELRAEDATTPKTGAYPAVEDVPPRPEKPGMTVDEQSKLKQELINARDRQTPQAKAKQDAPRQKSKKP
jgi:hypothetical protein